MKNFSEHMSLEALENFKLENLYEKFISEKGCPGLINLLEEIVAPVKSSKTTSSRKGPNERKNTVIAVICMLAKTRNDR